MKIAFTICSNNYLAQAKVLGDTLKENSPEYDFFIGLVDEKSDVIDYEKEIGHRIISVEDLKIKDFDSLWRKFDIIEFNTCVKPFYFEYFNDKFSSIEYLFYFDPDIAIFDSLSEIEKEFNEDGRILLTPHIHNPIELDGKTPGENVFLNYGLYNLGFLGLKLPVESLNMIKWWGERTYSLGFNKPAEGLFVDQLWFNLVPIFFKNVVISNHLGMNMGPWNLHERKLNLKNGNYFVNGKFNLVFYHFSNINFRDRNVLANYYNRFSFDDRQDLIVFYEKYINELISIGIEKISQILCVYMVKGNEYRLQIIEESKLNYYEKNKYRIFVKLLTPPLLVKMYKLLRKLIIPIHK